MSGSGILYGRPVPAENELVPDGFFFTFRDELPDDIVWKPVGFAVITFYELGCDDMDVGAG